MFLHLSQPIVRSGQRLRYRFAKKRLPRLSAPPVCDTTIIKSISHSTRDIYWDNQAGIGREQLLDAMVAEAEASNWPGDFRGGWVEWDLELFGDAWHHIHIRTVSEELGWPRRFTRARSTASLTGTARLTAAIISIWTAAALIAGSIWGGLVGLLALVGFLIVLGISRTRCLKATTSLLLRASVRAGFAGSQNPDGVPPNLDRELDEIVPVYSVEGPLRPAVIPLHVQSQRLQ